MNRHFRTNICTYTHTHTHIYIYIYIYIYIFVPFLNQFPFPCYHQIQHVQRAHIYSYYQQIQQRGLAQWWDSDHEHGTAYLRITDRVFCKDRPGCRKPVGFILGPTGFHDNPVGFVIPVPNRPVYFQPRPGFIHNMEGVIPVCNRPGYKKPDRVWYAAGKGG